MRVVITGGGTGGHIYPALSIARQLRKSGAELLFIGSRHGPEGKLAKAEDIPFKSVPSGPIAGLSLRTARSLFSLSLGIVKAHSILRRFRPDVLVGTGGYTSAGVALAEWLRGGRVIIHEQNSVPGRTNLWLARIAKKVCVTFEESVPFFPAGKTVVTGLPVRSEIVQGKDKAESRTSFGLDPARFTVLVLGGSQGARRVNHLVLEAAPGLIDAGLQVIHQVGRKNYEDVMSKRPETASYVVRPYIEDMAAAYSAADLVVSRSGASSIAEITLCGLPAVFIPYPFAAAGHQEKNALAVVSAGAAIALEEKGLTGNALLGIILDLILDKPRLDAMAAASKKLGRPDAAEEIARVVAEVTGHREEGIGKRE